MIPFDFDYYRPETLHEAVHIYQELKSANPFYYSGGSEIISMSRLGSICPSAVIDLKAIPECTCMDITSKSLIIGSAVSLTRIAESNLFPFLSTTIKRIADHTNQCRITIGGNVCGTIIYRESVIPLLISECDVVVQTANGLKNRKINELWNGRMILEQGDFIVQFIIDREYLFLPYFHIKKVKNEKIDYPLITIGMLKKDGLLRAAFSGICEFPFRSLKIEKILNEKESPDSVAQKICNALPAPPINNIDGSDGYRLFVLKNTIVEMLKKIGEI